MPDIDARIHQEYADEGVLVYGVHSGEDPAQLDDFIEQTGVSFPIIGDEGNTLYAFDYPEGVGYPYPRDVIVGPDLTIHSIKNSFDVDEAEALIQDLLAD